MPSFDEALAGTGGEKMAGGLRAGVETVSQNQVITFTKYMRRVLPLDGFTFWVRIDQCAGHEQEKPTVDITGSLHYTITKTNNDQGLYGQTNVTFTSESDAIQNSSADLLVGSFEDFRFAFATTGHYKQSGLWHYGGIAVVPSMLSQLIDDGAVLSDADLIVSNTIPLWLSYTAYRPFYNERLVCPCALYPSGQSPFNLKPPFATISVDNTESLVSSPTFDDRYSAYVLAKEIVTLKTFGLNNSQASDMRDGIYAWSRDLNLVGLMNAPVFTDDRVPQVELLTLAMAKTMKLEVTYVQKDVRNIARQYIKRAVPSFIIREPFADAIVGE